jgi:hypothetical protein
MGAPLGRGFRPARFASYNAGPVASTNRSLCACSRTRRCANDTTHPTLQQEVEACRSARLPQRVGVVGQARPTHLGLVCKKVCPIGQSARSCGRPGQARPAQYPVVDCHLSGVHPLRERSLPERGHRMSPRCHRLLSGLTAEGLPGCRTRHNAGWHRAGWFRAMYGATRSVPAARLPDVGTVDPAPDQSMRCPPACQGTATAARRGRRPRRWSS